MVVPVVVIPFADVEVDSFSVADLGLEVDWVGWRVRSGLIAAKSLSLEELAVGALGRTEAADADRA